MGKARVKARLRKARATMDTDSGAPSPASKAEKGAPSDTMDTSEFGASNDNDSKGKKHDNALGVNSLQRRTALKRGSKTTKQRRRKAAKQAKAAAVGARRITKAKKGKGKAMARAEGKTLWKAGQEGGSGGGAGGVETMT